MGSWSLTKDKINFRHINPYPDDSRFGDLVIDDSFHYSSTEWMIGSKRGELHEAEYACCPGVIYQDFRFLLELKRFRATPIISLLIPCGVTALLTLLTFFVPPDANEKIELSKYSSEKTALTLSFRYRSFTHNGRIPGSTL